MCDRRKLFEIACYVPQQNPPPAGCRKRPQDGISREHKVAVVEKCFRGYFWWFGNICEYIGKRIRSGGSRGPTRQGARPTGGRPPISWGPRRLLDLHSKLSGSCSLQKSRSRRFHSVWTPFGIPFLRNTEISKKTAISAGPPINRLVPKII